MAYKNRFKTWLLFNFFILFLEINLFPYSHEQQLIDDDYLTNENDLNLVLATQRISHVQLVKHVKRQENINKRLETSNNTTTNSIQEDTSWREVTSSIDGGNVTSVGIVERSNGGRPSLAYSIIVSIVFMTIILATLIGNMLVILAVVIVRKLHTQDNANNYLIVSLAVSDLLVGVFVMPFAFYIELSPENK